MSRYIDSEKFDCVAFKGIPDGYKDTFADGLMYALNRIDEEPTVDAVEVKHGHWEVAIGTCVFGYDPKKPFQCSECRLMAYKPTEYCPHCGAKMNEVTE